MKSRKRARAEAVGGKEEERESEVEEREKEKDYPLKSIMVTLLQSKTFRQASKLPLTFNLPTPAFSSNFDSTDSSGLCLEIRISPNFNVGISGVSVSGIFCMCVFSLSLSFPLLHFKLHNCNHSLSLSLEGRRGQMHIVKRGWSCDARIVVAMRAQCSTEASVSPFNFMGP